MSGHSKWSTIKHKKAANDAKKGVIYTKLGRNITLAAKDGGGDYDSNFKLRLAIDLAKEANMPAENIERAIKKGTGELKDGSQIQQITYEFYGPGTVPMLVDTMTDNPNRTVTDVRKIVTGHGGSMGSAGAVSWQFEELGLVLIRPAIVQKSTQFGKPDEIVEKDSELVTLEIMDIEGVRDIADTTIENADGSVAKALEILTERSLLDAVHKQIEALGYLVKNAEIVKVSKNLTEVDQETVEKIDRLIDALNDLDDTQNVWDGRK